MATSTIPVPPYTEMPPPPPADRGEQDRPRAFNGATRYGLFGPPKMRHPWELPMLGLGIVLSSLAMLTWWLVVIVGIWMIATGEIDPATLNSTDDTTTADTWGGILGEGVASIFGTFFVQVFLLVGIIWIVLWIARAVQHAQLRLQGVRMSSSQFPEGYRMVAEAAAQYGLRRIPDAYVISGSGSLNAFATGHGFRRFVAVYSDMFELGGEVRDPEALRFVIAHEVGHVAAGHTSYLRLVFANLLYQIPILGMAYSRAQEYTADNFGYQTSPSGSAGAVSALAAGKYLNAHVNVHELADRAHREKGFLLHLYVWFTATHPPMTWRAAALRDRSKPGSMWLRPRSASFSSTLPASYDRGRTWPTPEQVIATLDERDAHRPQALREQWGRYPGMNYDGQPPIRDLQVAVPFGERAVHTDAVAQASGPDAGGGQ